MGDATWSTYTGEQARQVTSGLQILLDKGLLSKDEAELARKIQTKLRNACQKEEITMVPFSKDEEELVRHVEGSLWK